MSMVLQPLINFYLARQLKLAVTAVFQAFLYFSFISIAQPTLGVITLLA